MEEDTDKDKWLHYKKNTNYIQIITYKIYNEWDSKSNSTKENLTTTQTNSLLLL